MIERLRQWARDRKRRQRIRAEARRRMRAWSYEQRVAFFDTPDRWHQFFMQVEADVDREAM